ncbi:MAG: dTDP-4-dehydrorhamnose 3,5-epimerase [Gammaproteobacteria bacterium]|nr:dTDP-4-dehydrorhamnose 3,5-epimerase [Gammaproteobacteria bacterium]
MHVTKGPLSGLIILAPKVFKDERGYFFEVYQQEHYQSLGLPLFVQDNFSHSEENVLRGLHYQYPHAQGKLVWVTKGTVWDVVVDIRTSSPTFGKWFSIILSEENHLQMYIPPGFAHGFCVLSSEADFNYQCTDFYSPQHERGIAWNDKRLNISWPINNPILSPKDQHYPALHEISNDYLFT